MTQNPEGDYIVEDMNALRAAIEAFKGWGDYIGTNQRHYFMAKAIRAYLDALRTAEPVEAAAPSEAMRDELLAADASDPEATFDNGADMLDWLNAPAAAPSEEPVAWRGVVDGRTASLCRTRDEIDRLASDYNATIEPLGVLASPAVAPVAWRVLAEPDLPVHFVRTDADAKHLVNNLLTYRKGCTSARIDPLYSFEMVASKP